MTGLVHVSEPIADLDAYLKAIREQRVDEEQARIAALARHCPDCDGGLAPVPVYGSWREEPYEYVKCRTCRGTGIVYGAAS